MNNYFKKSSVIAISIVVFLGLLVSYNVNASTDNETKDIISAYRQVKEISLPKISIPKVAEIPFDSNGLERADFLVFDTTIQTFQPSLLIKKEIKENRSASIVVSGLDNQNFYSERMTDNNDNTYAEIPLPNSGLGNARIILESDTEITSNSVFILLDNYVALPKTISVYSGEDNNLKTILSSQVVNSQVVNFPKTTSKRWVFDLTYGQPLRITEIRLGGLSTNLDETYKLRFLAQPDHQYNVYFNPDRHTNVSLGEMPNLYDNEGVMTLPISISKENKGFVPSDVDKDGIEDTKDNCVNVANFDQKDEDNNGRGDACDDYDKDGVINSLDNCRDIPNYNQADSDGDKIGDVCDPTESRLTEQYKWLPWLGIGLAGIIVIVLFVFTAMSMKDKNKNV